MFLFLLLPSLSLTFRAANILHNSTDLIRESTSIVTPTIAPLVALNVTADTTFHANGFFFLGLLLSAFTVSGNVIIIISYASEPRLQTLTNLWIVSMCCTDTFLAVVVMPVSAVSDGFDQWVFGRVACELFITLDIVCCTCSIYHLCLISLDRYFCIRFPMTYPKRRTKKLTLIAVGSVWALCILVSTPRLFFLSRNSMQDDLKCKIRDRTYVLISSTISFYIPFVIIIWTYTLMFRATKQHTKKLSTTFGALKRELSKQFSRRFSSQRNTSKDNLSDDDQPQNSGEHVLSTSTSSSKPMLNRQPTGINKNCIENMAKQALQSQEKRPSKDQGMPNRSQRARSRSIAVLRKIADAESSESSSSSDDQNSVEEDRDSGVELPCPQILITDADDEDERPSNFVINIEDSDAIVQPLSAQHLVVEDANLHGILRRCRSSIEEPTYMKEDGLDNPALLSVPNDLMVHSPLVPRPSLMSLSSICSTSSEWDNTEGDVQVIPVGLMFPTMANPLVSRYAQRKTSEQPPRRSRAISRSTLKGITRSEGLQKLGRSFRRKLRKNTLVNKSRLERIRRRQERRAGRIIAIVIATFITFWAPFFILHVAEAYCNCVPELTFRLLTYLGYGNSCINPIIYTAFNKNFRHTAIRTIRCRCTKVQGLQRQGALGGVSMAHSTTGSIAPYPLLSRMSISRASMMSVGRRLSTIFTDASNRVRQAGHGSIRSRNLSNAGEQLEIVYEIN